MSALRPLPPVPNLEFEHKEAKTLLRQIRAGEPDALARARARHPAIDTSAPERIRLADAQLVIAREYGFTSWPRLVRYFGDVDRQRHNPNSMGRPDSYEGWARSLLAGHRRRSSGAGRALASYVPRFYGMRLDDVFAATVTEDDARLAVARTNGSPSWDVLLERAGAEQRQRSDEEWEVDPIRYAGEAMKAADLPELQRVIAAHPDLLQPSDYDVSTGHSLFSCALADERRQGRAALRPIIEWLVAQGLDLKLELNRQLCGQFMRTSAEDVRWLLDRGADPNWIAPNGIPVLEHALLRYWDGAAVDVLAAHAVPRRALWIAAGLGDVDGVRRSLDARGKPTRTARRIRPDFDAVGPATMPQHPDPDDQEILMEAFFVAASNGRTAVMEHMASRGFDVNTLVWETPVLNVAVGNAWTPLVECLVRCGADLDLKGSRPDQSARAIAREMFEQAPQNADYRRIVELCGMDPDAVLAERDARPVNPPGVDPRLQQALELAGDDAFRLGQRDIRPENLFFGLLRNGGLQLMHFTKVTLQELDRFRADVRDRVRPTEDRVQRPHLLMDADAQAVIQAAIAIATERRREWVHGLHLLYTLTQANHGVVAELLKHYGSSALVVNAELERHL